MNKKRSLTMNKERRMGLIANKERRVHLTMNKRGGMADILMNNAVYLILLALFTAGMFVFLGNTKNATSMWQEADAKEIARVIDMAKPGDLIRLNVHHATVAAMKNGVTSADAIFSFDNINKNVCANLAPSKSYCYPFFNDVIIADYQLEQGVPGNVLSFRVAKASGAAGGTA